MSIIILFALVLGAPAAAYAVKRRSQHDRLEPRSAGRAVIASNLAASRRR